MQGFTSGRTGENDPAMPYNAVGERANLSDEWSLANDPQVFCDLPGLVRQAAYTPYGQKIQQYPDHVTIEYEEYGSRRAIFFDDEVAQPGPPSRLGDSVARYEGDTLVIETVNLLANLSGHTGKPLSDQIRVVEVYSREDHAEWGTNTLETIVFHRYANDLQMFGRKWNGRIDSGPVSSLLHLRILNEMNNPGI